MSDGESFGSRWSRLKREARESGDAREPPAAPGVSAASAAASGEISGSGPICPAGSAPAGPGQAPPELPSIDSLQGLAGEYRDFLRPEVGDELRRAALKKLFADPHFNQIDLFEAYSGDYTQFDPIPAAMMASLEQAKRLWVSADDPDGSTEASDGKQMRDGAQAAAVPAEAGSGTLPAIEPGPDPLADAVTQAEAGQPALPDWDEASLLVDEAELSRTSSPDAT